MKLTEGIKKLQNVVENPDVRRVLKQIHRLQKKVEKAVYAVVAAGALGGAAISGDMTLSNLPQQNVEVTPERKILACYEHTGDMSHLRESGVLPENKKWAVTANGEAFSELATTLENAPATRELLEKEKLSLVYPGSGMHLSPLEMARQLAEKSTTLNEIDLTYTEVKPDFYKEIDKVLKTYVDRNSQFSDYRLETIEPSTSLEKDPDSPRRKIMTFTFTNSDQRQIKMKLDFQYKMSGEKYFSKEVSDQSNFFIMHDSSDEAYGNGKSKLDIKVLLENLDFSSDHPQKVFAVINDDEILQKRHGYTNQGVFQVLGKVVAAQDGLPFGCGQNHWDDQKRRNKNLSEAGQKDITERAIIVEIDMAVLAEIKKMGGKDALIAYASLGDIYLENGAKMVSPEQYEALLKVARQTDNAQLKDKLRNLAQYQLDNPQGFNIPLRDMLVDSPAYQIYKIILEMARL